MKVPEWIERRPT